MHTHTDSAPAQALPPPSPPPPLPPRLGDDGRTLYVQGLTALRDGDCAMAAALLTGALQLQPTHPGVRRNLVRALLVGEHYDQVVTQADAALACAPDDAELHFARGTALNATGHHAGACAAFARALSLNPDHAPSWLNMGNASADMDDLASAETLYRTAIRLDPALAEAHASLGYVLTMFGRLDEATEACEAAIRLRPDFPQAHWNLANTALLAGDLARGFAEYEWRKQHARYRLDFPTLSAPVWDGSDPAGKTILIRAEQGLGDAIQFARYLPQIHAAGGHPVLLCSPALVPLLGSMAGVQVVAPEQTMPAYDMCVDQASLPHIMRTSLDTIPAPFGYLHADLDRVARWRERLPAGQKVGVVFTGNPRHPADRQRSISLDLVSSLPRLPGLTFINLHHGATARGLGLPDWTPWLTDYAETAALIENLDLVVTVDTSVAHLAGALGKPTWVLLPHAPDWRWLLGRTDSPWYHSVRLFRQTVAGDWTGVLAHMMDQVTHIGGSVAR